MIISPISTVATAAARSPSAINAATDSATIRVLSTAIADNTGLLDAIPAIRSNDMTVDVSALGELLAYTVRLQNKRTANVTTTVPLAVSADQAQTAQTKADIAQLTTIATSFVDAFNQLQASNSNLAENPLIPTSSDSLLLVMNAGTQSADGSSLFEQLGKIGINLQNVAQPNNDSFLTLDVSVFQNALAEDPVGTTALLAQALQILVKAESTVIAQNQELASGNILTNTSINDTENPDLTSSTESTSINNKVSNSASPPANLNEDAGTATTNANAELQRALGDEALQVAIDITRNSQATFANTNGTDNIASNAAQASPEIPVSPEIRTAAATNNAANISQSNAAINSAIDTSTVARTAASSGAATDIGSNAIVATGTTDINVNSKALSAETEVADITTSLPSQTQGTQIRTQPPPAETVDTPKVLQAAIATQSKLSSSITTPSALPTESQLENQVAANTSKLNESAASSSASGIAETTLNTPSTFEEVSKTLDTINQATAAATNIAANKLSAAASQASTAVTTPVPVNASAQQTTPVNNSAAVNTSASATGIQASINPLIAAAIASLRVRDGIQTNPLEKSRPADADTVTAPEAVIVVEPVTLDLHEHAKNQRQEAEIDSAYLQAEELGEPEEHIATSGKIDINA